MNSAEGLALVARVVGGLVIVLVLIAISARIARRTRHFGGGTDLEIVDRLGISKDNQLAVVRVAGRHLLLGIGPQGVSMLSHLDDPAMAFEPGAPVIPTLTAGPPTDDNAHDDAHADDALPTDDTLPTDDPLATVPAGSAATPSLPPAPATIAELPEEVAAELLARFEALARQEELEASARAEEAEAAAARSRTRAGGEQPLRRPRRRHADPEPEPAYGTATGAPVVPRPSTGPEVSDVPEVPEVQLPGALNLGDYPDLASALRAAGRTTADPQSQELESALPGSSSWIPAQRRGRDTDLSHATSSAPVVPAGAAASDPDPEDGSTGRRRGKARRVPNRQQASGSVLSPGTWRQGIEALREYTVRRG